MQEAKDITIIGAGPTGLFAAFYAGMRGASHRLIDNLDQVGGQLTALYPEKYIFDVAGFPKILSKDLVKALAEQGLQWKPPVHLGEKVIGLRRSEENGKTLFTILTDKDEYPGRTVLIAGGIGAFTPRKLPLKDADRWNDKGLHDRRVGTRDREGRHQGHADDGDQHPRHLRRRRHHHLSRQIEAHRDRVWRGVHCGEPDRALPESGSQGHAWSLVEHGALWTEGRLARQLHHNRVDLRKHLSCRHVVRVGLDRKRDDVPIRFLDISRQRIHPVDRSRLRQHPSFDWRPREPPQ